MTARKGRSTTESGDLAVPSASVLKARRVRFGSFSEVGGRNCGVYFAPSNGHRQPGQTCRKGRQSRTLAGVESGREKALLEQ
jgi:hypothetical protein